MSCCKRKELKLVYERMCVATHALLKKPIVPPHTIHASQVQSDGHVVSLEVKQIHKRREPHKHYIYELVVTWSSGANLHVFRRYSNFFEFQVQLSAQQSLLVGLGGSTQMTNTVIPTLPCRAFIGRSNVKQVAQKRKDRLEEFCESIMNLPQELICSDIFTRFFSLWPDDTDSVSSPDPAQPGEDDMDSECTEFIAIADYDPTNMHQIAVSAGMKLQVLERRLSGWWLCLAGNEQGYLPASILQPLEGIHDNEKVEDFSCKYYIANAGYISNNSDELTLKKGQTVQVVFKSYDGWWRVKCGEDTGIVPSLYLTESEHQQRKDTLERISKKELYTTPSNSFNPPPRRGTLGRNEKIVSMYSVLEEVPQETVKRSSVKYALINKSKNDKKKANAEIEDIIHKMLDISLDENPDISINYELSDQLVKGMQLTQSLHSVQNQGKLPKPPKPPRKHVNAQEPTNNMLQRSPSTPSFVDNSIYQNMEKVSHTNILSRPFDASDCSLVLSNNKCSVSKDDEDIDYINWLPSIDPINVDDVNEYTVSSPFGHKSNQHLSLRESSSMPQKVLPKMFVAIEQYTAQNEACVSFKTGDNATLIEKSEDAVWSFVRVNGEEGWSPSEYWKPIALKKPGKVPPPNIKPTRPTKVVTPIDVPSPASRRLSSYEKKPLPVPPARNIAKAPPTVVSAPPPPVSLRPAVEQPEAPRRTKSPMTVLATSSQPVAREGKVRAREETGQLLWGKMTRKFCEELLLHRAKQGEFIFRESTNREGELVLSMRYHYRVHHFNIKQEDNWYCIGEKFRVRTLSEIILHFQKTPIASYKEYGDKLIDVFLSRPLEKDS